MADGSDRVEEREPNWPRSTLLVVLGALMLLWSAGLNGRPSVFPDTALYVSEGEYLAQAIGVVSPADRIAPHDPTALPARPGAADVSATIDGARSPVYAAFVYALVRLGGLWLVAAVQAGTIAFVLLALVRCALRRNPEPAYLGLTALLSATSSLPFFASYVMPDVFAGVAAAAMLAMLVYPDRLTRPTRVALVAILAFSLAVHRSNLVEALAVSGAAAALFALLGIPSKAIVRRIAPVVLGAVAAAGACLLLSLPIASRASEAIHDPPFLAARLLADGPGQRYLQQACDRGADYALCAFRGQPMEDSDTILWSPRAADGVFGVASYPTRLRIEREESRFVLGVLTYDPLGEFEAMARNTLRQLKMNHVGSPLSDPARFVDDGYWRRTSLPRIIPDAAACRAPGACASKLPSWLVNQIGDAVLLLSLGFLAWRLTQPDAVALILDARTAPEDDRTRLLLALALFAVLVLANAAVCGALSAPVSRYQARLIWLLPGLAALTAMTLRLQPVAAARADALETEISPAFSAT